MAIINEVELNKKFESLAKSKRYTNFMWGAANTRTIAAKNALLDELDENIVIQEIVSSSKDPSISNSEIVSKGNLTAFLGLEAGQGEGQINGLKTVINANISTSSEAKVKWTKNKATYSFVVKTPTQTSMESVTPVGWTTKSWIPIIENGISSTLRKFIFWSEGFGAKSNSRSGTGLQTKGDVANVAELTPTPFIKQLFIDFKAKFE